MSQPPRTCDFAVVGAGIVGLAVARELSLRHRGAAIAVFEREGRVAAHQTRHSSGVIHSGIYYEPESLKARLCVEGARRLYGFCEEREIETRRDGKLILAVDSGELERLTELERRGRANGVLGLERIGASDIAAIEPGAAGIAALFSPSAGVVSFAAIAEALAAELTAGGTTVHLECEIAGIRERPGGVVLTHSLGSTTVGVVVSCAGGWADRLAEASGADPEPRIVPFRGAFTEVTGKSADLVRASVYPVPDPELPFLGAHLTRSVDGRVIAGPTSFPVGAPDAHERRRLEPRSVRRTLGWPGTWRLGRRRWRSAAHELATAAIPGRLAADLRRLVPAIDPADLRPAGGGVRAQAVARDGSLIDDFVVSRTERMVHVRNAPSPAATACLALAELICDQI